MLHSDFRSLRGHSHNFCILFLLGGYSLVPSTRDTPRISSLLYTCWYLVCGMHICWDDQPKALISWRLRDWSTLQDFQVSLLASPVQYSSIYYNWKDFSAMISRDSENTFILISHFGEVVKNTEIKLFTDYKSVTAIFFCLLLESWELRTRIHGVG